MLDPTDAVFNRLQVGDQTTTGDPSAGAYGEPPAHIEADCPPNQWEPLADFQALATEQTIRSAYPPAYWIVTVSPVAAAEITVYHGPGAAGVPIRLYSGWTARIPGQANTDLTVVGIAGTPDVNVVAVRGYDAWIRG